MDLHLKGKKALVTGSTAGIGLAIAVALTDEGATVVVNGRTQGRVNHAMQAVRKTCRQHHHTPHVSGVAADLSTSHGADEVYRQLPEADILVHNLGIYQPKPFDKISDVEWLRFFKVNVLSAIRLTRHYLPGMFQRNWGRIVFISSESGVQIPAEMIHYGMTKTAQLAIARGLAETTAGTGVTVNSVLPGPTRSEGVDHFVSHMARAGGKSEQDVEAEFFETVRPTSLLRRFATPEEVANMVTYVCSPLSSATNGAALRVDGGVVRSIL